MQNQEIENRNLKNEEIFNRLLISETKISKEKTYSSMQSSNLVQVMATPQRPLNMFSKFVKENYQSVKKENSNLNHKEIMKELGSKYKQL